MAKIDQHPIDELFEVKNAFYLGNYQLCIKEAQKVRSNVDADVAIMRDVFMYRSYVSQKKYSVILDEISQSSSTPAELRAIRFLAEYMGSSSQEKLAIVSKVEQILAKSIPEFNNSVFYLIAAQISIHEGNIEQALRTLNNGMSAIGYDLECESTIVQCLLKIDRDDLALKHIKKMQDTDDDSILTQLSMAWTYIALGKDKLQDAFYIYQEMIDKYGATPLLLNSQACILIMQEKYDLADKLLQESMEKDNNNPETLINLIVVSRHLGKSFELCNRYINQMKDGFPNHLWTKDHCAKENEFNRLCGQYEAGQA